MRKPMPETNRQTPPLQPRLLCVLLIATAAGCSSVPAPPVVEREARAQGMRAPAAPAPRGGGYYKDDGPGDYQPPDLDRIADAQPRVEPLHRFANNPYNVFGQDYVPMKSVAPFRQSGIASWYGRKFHGQRTSSGEVYDMYAMTAAHPTLPIPSYVRVTNQQNGRSVVVRINDRGPFHAGRAIDLSFAAAFKLGYVIAGSSPVQVELLQPDEIARLAAAKGMAQKPSPGTTAAVAATAHANPPPSTDTAPPAQAAPARGNARSVFLQLGAFSARDNAESFRTRVYRELGWLNDSIEILQRDGLFRLHLGPYRDRIQAEGMAERLRRDIDLIPVYVMR